MKKIIVNGYELDDEQLKPVLDNPHYSLIPKFDSYTFLKKLFCLDIIWVLICQTLFIFVLCTILHLWYNRIV